MKLFGRNSKAHPRSPLDQPSGLDQEFGLATLEPEPETEAESLDFYPLQSGQVSGMIRYKIGEVVVRGAYHQPWWYEKQWNRNRSRRLPSEYAKGTRDGMLGTTSTRGRKGINALCFACRCIFYRVGDSRTLHRIACREHLCHKEVEWRIFVGRPLAASPEVEVPSEVEVQPKVEVESKLEPKPSPTLGLELLEPKLESLEAVELLRLILVELRSLNYTWTSPVK